VSQDAGGNDNNMSLTKIGKKSQRECHPPLRQVACMIDDWQLASPITATVHHSLAAQPGRCDFTGRSLLYWYTNQA